MAIQMSKNNLKKKKKKPNETESTDKHTLDNNVVRVRGEKKCRVFELPLKAAKVFPGVFSTEAW